MRSALVASMLAIHAALLALGSWHHSPTCDEVGHLPAGLSHLHTGRFDLYHVNPPLVRMVAAIPVAASPTSMANFDWPPPTIGARREWEAGRQFFARSGDRVCWYFTVARWACIPFSLLGAVICGYWATRLHGRESGVFAMALWCFSPTVLAHGQLITPDVAAASIGATAFYVFWRWLVKGTWLLVLGAGVALGLALLTKSTWIVLFGLWPAVWVAWRWPERASMSRGKWSRQAAQLGLVCCLGLYVLNMGYGFEKTGQRLGDFAFLSRALAGRTEPLERPRPDNRFAGTYVAVLPVPVPASYVQGIDWQRREFELGKWSYLRGEWRHGGWWYYYLYSLAVKAPLGTWLLGLLACGVILLRRGYSATWRDEMVLLAPIVVVLVLVSSQTGFNHHMRYVLPILPFAFVWISKVARAIPYRHKGLAVISVAALAWSVSSSLWCYPHNLSYFNESIGGPSHGAEHLLGSNFDWGQDLLPLKQWLDRHSEARPISIAYSLPVWLVDPADLGIDYTVPAFGVASDDSDVPEEQLGPRPGWYAVFTGALHQPGHEYDYFRHFKPASMVGYTVYVYHISPEGAQRVRQEMGLPKWRLPEGTPGATDR